MTRGPFSAAFTRETGIARRAMMERGYGREDSTVTVCASEAPHNINDHGSTTAEGIGRDPHLRRDPIGHPPERIFSAAAS